MSRDASITIDFGDGTYHFRLAWGQIVKLQEECDAGPYVILQRLYGGTWKVQDISSVIRWGLIGGGLDPAQALRLVRTYVESRPPVENLLTAQAVLSAGCVGAPDEDAGKKAEAPDQESGSTVFPTENSGSEPSTEPAHA